MWHFKSAVEQNIFYQIKQLELHNCNRLFDSRETVYINNTAKEIITYYSFYIFLYTPFFFFFF